MGELKLKDLTDEQKWNKGLVAKYVCSQCGRFVYDENMNKDEWRDDECNHGYFYRVKPDGETVLNNGRLACFAKNRGKLPSTLPGLFFRRVIEELDKNPEFVVKVEGNTAHVRHKGDPNGESGRVVSLQPDKWVRVEEWNGSNPGEEPAPKPTWVEFDPCNPKISTYDVIEKIGDCTDLMRRFANGYIVGCDEEHHLLEYTEEDYLEHIKKLEKQQAESGIRNSFPREKLPTLYKNVEKLDDAKWEKAYEVYYVHFFREYENKWMYLKDNEPVESFDQCEFFDRPGCACAALREHTWSPHEWSDYIDPEKHVRIFRVWVYKKTGKIGLLSRIKRMLKKEKAN